MSRQLFASLRISGLFAALASLLTGVGCSRGVPLGKVHGQVTFQGAPVTSAIVGFDGSTTPVHMTANVDSKGEYEVSMAKGFGLPLGTYRVAVYPYVADLPIGSKTRPVKHTFKDIPPKYRKPATSGLVLTVQAGDNPYNIDMKP